MTQLKQFTKSARVKIIAASIQFLMRCHSVVCGTVNQMRLPPGAQPDWRLPQTNRARRYSLPVFNWVIQRSSVVERSAVNRLVVGSNPTAGAISMLWVYILQNPAERFYNGHTDNLGTRVASHNRTDKISGKFTRKNEPWTLVWLEEHPDRSSAARRERQIKS